ncbi:MAG: hypothetical protein KTR18_06600 [Acidiferrobacterales bacterium]|nr:hypothetical protein [Acidiferrobacterales bacterium]
MKLTKGLNLVIGFLSIVSVVGMLSVSFILPEFMNSENIIQNLKLRNMLQPIFMYLAIFLVISYLIYTLIGGRVAKERKFLWAGLLIVANVLVVPFFWYFELWKNQHHT